MCAMNEEQRRDLRRLIVEAYGQASAFKILTTTGDDLAAQLQAAKDTGKTLQDTIQRMFHIVEQKHAST